MVKRKHFHSKSRNHVYILIFITSLASASKSGSPCLPATLPCLNGVCFQCLEKISRLSLRQCRCEGEASSSRPRTLAVASRRPVDPGEPSRESVSPFVDAPDSSRDEIPNENCALRTSTPSNVEPRVCESEERLLFTPVNGKCMRSISE